MTTLLVAFASKHNSTAEIARAMGEILESYDHLRVILRPVSMVDDLTGYDAVVLGSAVYMGNWQETAADFLRDHEDELAKLPVWLFSTGPTGEGDPHELMKGWTFPEALKLLAERIHPRDIALFHGKLDTGKLNFLERSAIKMVKAPVGDFRDWNIIREWAEGIAETLCEPLEEKC